MSQILRELLRVSERAANIARACRQQQALFQLLIEEKKEGEKNKKFSVDFKTLADVLVQEVIKQNMENKFPGLEKNIFGEESNEFTNDLGEKITVRLCSAEEETAELLSKVLNGNQSASGALAKVVHQDVAFTDATLDSVEISIPQDTLGIWVDPIDSTYQYIKGSTDIKSNQGIFPSGLQCVTILIGVYDIQTGVPLMGVINQPFVTQDPKTLRWKGQCYWGLSYMGTNIHSPSWASLKERGKCSRNAAALRHEPPTLSRPSSAPVKRRPSRLRWHACVVMAFSEQPGLVTRACVLSKALLTFTSFQKTPRSSGTPVLLMPY